MNATAQPLIRVRDEELACIHRDLSVCDGCFDATPGLIDVWGATYRYEGEPFQIYDHVREAQGHERGHSVVVSPGTQEGEDYDR